MFKYHQKFTLLNNSKSVEKVAQNLLQNIVFNSPIPYETFVCSNDGLNGCAWVCLAAWLTKIWSVIKTGTFLYI